jgi:streptogramin lyase
MPFAPACAALRARRPRWRALIAAGVLASGSAGGAALEPGDILVTDFSADKVFVVDPDTGSPTDVGSSAFLNAPVGVAVRNDGFAFVTNVSSQLVVRVDPGALPPSPVHVLISAFMNPRGIAIDPTGDLFVSSPSTDQILRVDSVTGVATPVAGSGILLFPSGLVREPNGTLVIADGSTIGPKVLRVDPQTGIQTPLAAGGLLRVPRDVEVDPSADCSSPDACSLLVIDSGSTTAPAAAPSVIRIDATLPFNADQPLANQTSWAACPEFQSPRGIAVEADGDVLVSDFSAKQVFVIHPTPPPRVCIPLIPASPLVGPWDVAVVPILTPFDPGDLLVAGGTADQVYRVDPGDGTSVPIWPGLGFDDPVAVIRAPSNDYFVLEKSTIQRVTAGGVKTLVATVTPSLPADVAVDLTGIVVDANGELLVTDKANDRLLRVFPGTGQVIVIADDDADPSAPLGAPAGLALDRNGTALIANRGDTADTPPVPTGIVRVNPSSGTASAVSNDVQFGELVGVVLDTNGDYLFSDLGNDRVWRLRASTPNNPLLFPVSVGNDTTSLRGLLVDLNRSLVVSNQGAKEILRLDPPSGVQTEVAPVPVFSDIRGIALDLAASPPVLDSDGDGTPESTDNCPELANPDQLDSDVDGRGDVCDDDDDGDGIADLSDNCSLLATTDQTDSNQDGFGNRCDADYASAVSQTLGDLLVSAPDFIRFKAAFGSSSGQAAYSAEIDSNSDGAIGAADFLLFKASFQKAPGPSGLVCKGTIPCLPPPPPP